jgi:tetratricopeptide (TPR) repeat protein
VQRQIPLSRAHKLLLSSLYERAAEAEEEEEWHQAVNLFNRIVKIAPQYQDVPERLAHAGLRARLAALYTAAKTALREERLQEAIDELSEIVSVDANFHDAAELLTQAGMALAEIKTQQRVAELYERGLIHYENREWQEADGCFIQVLETDPNYRDVSKLYLDAHRRARWSGSLLGRVGHKLANLVNASEAEHASETTPEGE